jgi:hypothetical protein
MFRPLTDIYGLVNQGRCGPVKHSLIQKNQSRILFQKILAIDNYTIKLFAKEASDFIGSYEVQLNFNLVDFNYQYSFPFMVIISKN